MEGLGSFGPPPPRVSVLSSAYERRRAYNQLALEAPSSRQRAVDSEKLGRTLSPVLQAHESALRLRMRLLNERAQQNSGGPEVSLGRHSASRAASRSRALRNREAAEQQQTHEQMQNPFVVPRVPPGSSSRSRSSRRGSSSNRGCFIRATQPKEINDTNSPQEEMHARRTRSLSPKSHLHSSSNMHSSSKLGTAYWGPSSYMDDRDCLRIQNEVEALLAISAPLHYTLSYSTSSVAKASLAAAAACC